MGSFTVLTAIVSPFVWLQVSWLRRQVSTGASPGQTRLGLWGILGAART